MATHADSTGATVPSALTVDKIYVFERTADLVGVATGDTVEVLAIPANTLVLNVMTELVQAVATADGATTATVGDGSTANGWDAAITLTAGTAVGTTACGVGGTDTYVTTGKLYATADTIDLVVTVATGPCTQGKVKVAAVCVKL